VPLLIRDRDELKKEINLRLGMLRAELRSIKVERHTPVVEKNKRKHMTEGRVGGLEEALAMVEAWDQNDAPAEDVDDPGENRTFLDD
jgi:hypothetical protein